MPDWPTPCVRVPDKLRLTSQPMKTQQTRGRGRRKKKESSSEEEEEEDFIRNKLHPAHRDNKENSVRRSRRSAGTTARKLQQKVISDEDTDESYKGSSSSDSDEKKMPKKTVRIVKSKPLNENSFCPTRSGRRK
nr:uncharacterized protein LOC128694031 [Cherax quadricarinatus]